MSVNNNLVSSGSSAVTNSSQNAVHSMVPRIVILGRAISMVQQQASEGSPLPSVVLGQGAQNGAVQNIATIFAAIQQSINAHQ